MRPAGKASRISPALLVAIVALVASLGGGAVAGVAVNALNKKEKKQVRKISKKQAKKQVRKVPAGPRGATGPQGIAGQAGTTGPQGDPGLSGLERVTSQSANNSVSEKVISANCSEGKERDRRRLRHLGGEIGDPAQPLRRSGRRLAERSHGLRLDRGLRERIGNQWYMAGFPHRDLRDRALSVVGCGPADADPFSGAPCVPAVPGGELLGRTGRISRYHGWHHRAAGNEVTAGPSDRSPPT